MSLEYNWNTNEIIEDRLTGAKIQMKYKWNDKLCCVRWLDVNEIRNTYKINKYPLSGARIQMKYKWNTNKTISAAKIFLAPKYK